MEKKLQIIIIALLLLILGSVLGLTYSLFGPAYLEDDYLIEIQEEDIIDAFGRDLKYDHYTFRLLTYEEFGRKIGKNVNDQQNIIDHGDENGYQIFYYDYAISLLKQGNCEFDTLLQQRVCNFEIIEVYDEDREVEITLVKEVQDE